MASFRSPLLLLSDPMSGRICKGRGYPILTVVSVGKVEVERINCSWIVPLILISSTTGEGGDVAVSAAIAIKSST
ncbi:hypothetical protein TNIN_389121 [Trichonephila inaurata madagascariensis]|uniref:Uncharacterized protein n=1 Tax=Trichonephila inaurata madagascariensis TaxID=2747483 RepID=A0A8X7BXZ6_9ARAC|nr:hypothetical protein TNIN_389121 [Trichonephila inaurata madagascariensis]